jgi:RHS repeat-associated protein
VQKYEYDNADRLLGPTYDAWGRITSLPAEYAGGKALTTSYFANDMVATQSQGGVTNTFQLDATGRQRRREQTGGVTGVEIFHYDGPSDSVAWTSLGSTWSRNITGIGGELAAVQESSGTTTFQLADLHGDVVATASASPTATKLLGTSRYSEFGEPEAGSAGRFGWLGGKTRRTELQSGVIQMGVRSYIPVLGRFLSPDPIPGGSANAYDYANGNPITGFDLSGESASDCESGIAGCQCKLWSHLKKGGRRGTMVVTVVRKCNRAGGITLTGYAQRWSQRTSPRASYHNIPSNVMAPVFPEVTEPCPATNRCQNYQKTEQLVHCTPGTEYQLNISWGFVYNVWGEAQEHQLNIQAHGKCA